GRGQSRGPSTFRAVGRSQTWGAFPLMNSAPTARDIGERTPSSERVLTREALAFLGRLQAEFGGRRADLLRRRRDRRELLAAGGLPSFANAGAAPGDWRVASAPKDLLDRRVEITGPAEP